MTPMITPMHLPNGEQTILDDCGTVNSGEEKVLVGSLIALLKDLSAKVERSHEIEAGEGFILLLDLKAASLRSKRFRAVSEQRKTEERDSRFWPREK